MSWETPVTFDPISLNSSVQISFAPKPLEHISGSSRSPNCNYTGERLLETTAVQLGWVGGVGVALQRLCLILSNRAVHTRGPLGALTQYFWHGAKGANFTF